MHPFVAKRQLFFCSFFLFSAIIVFWDRTLPPLETPSTEGFNDTVFVMVITANNVVSEQSDVNQLVPLVEQTIKHTGERIQQLSADSGFSSGKNLHDVAQKQIGAYIPDPEFYSRMRKGKQLNQENPYHKINFCYSEKEDTYTCPADKSLRFIIIRNEKAKSR